jgi:hypothetical protein
VTPCSLADLQTLGETYCCLHLRLQMEATSNVEIQGDSGIKINILEAIVPVIVKKSSHEHASNSEWLPRWSYMCSKNQQKHIFFTNYLIHIIESSTCFEYPTVHLQGDLYMQFYCIFPCIRVNSLIVVRMCFMCFAGSYYYICTGVPPYPRVIRSKT